MLGYFSEVASRVVEMNCENSIYFISEPFAAISNLGFFISAYLLFKSFKAKNTLKPVFVLLIILTSLVGISSLIYHTYNSSFTALLDIFCIYLYGIYSIFLILQKLFKKIAYSLFFVLVFISTQLGAFIIFPSHPFGLPTHHLVNVVFLILIILLTLRRYEFLKVNLLLIISFYILALVSRYFDNALCAINGVGTHPFWHLFIAASMYFIGKSFMDIETRKPTKQ